MFTKESAGKVHKRGGKISLSDRQRAYSNLNLCEEMTGKSRKCIIMEFQRNGLSPSIYAEVEIYLRGRVEYLVEKVNRDREKVAVPIPVKPKVKPKVNMDDIMAKVNSIVKPLGDIPEVKKPVMHAQTFNTPPPPIDIGGGVSRVFDPDSQ